MHYLLYFFSLIPFYILGSLPSGRILAARKGIEIEKHGSGNVGATNVARVLGKKAGALTLVVDVTKGGLAVGIASILTSSTDFHALAGLSAVLGHCFSIPKVWKGGKGVATALGVNLILAPYAAGSALIVFCIFLFSTKIVSLASVCAALSIPIVGMFMELPGNTVLCLCVISLIVTLRHKDNLIRLVEGREKKFSFAKKDSGASSVETP